MKISGWACVWILVAASALAACGPKKPEHYYVLCQDLDGAGWKLINAEKDDQGYLMACTYQSPDKQQIREDRCRANGCD